MGKSLQSKLIVVPLTDPYQEAGSFANPPLVVLNENHEDAITVILGFGTEDTATAYLLPGIEIGEELTIRHVSRPLVSELSSGDPIPNGLGSLAIRCLEPNTLAQSVRTDSAFGYSPYPGFWFSPDVGSPGSFVLGDEMWFRPVPNGINTEFVHLRWNGTQWVVIAHSNYTGYISRV